MKKQLTNEYRGQEGKERERATFAFDRVTRARTYLVEDGSQVQRTY